MSDGIQMKITLCDITPEIWRQFVVDSTVTLHQLHEIIQEVMGWEHAHLYGFTIRDVDYQIPDAGGWGPPDGEVKDARKTRLAGFGLTAGEKFLYVYDFGDNWEHGITVEDLVDVPDGEPMPYCIDGARNCPPEDCGSIPGYENLVEAMKQPRSDEYKELVEWLGKPFDPEKFDMKRINKKLHPAPKQRKSTRGRYPA